MTMTNEQLLNKYRKILNQIATIGDTGGTIGLKIITN